MATPTSPEQRALDHDKWVASNVAREIEEQKTQSYETDTDRKTFWDNVDSMTKDEFKAFVDGFITNQATAKTAIIRLALEVARLQRG